MKEKLLRTGNALLSLLAGLSSFIFTFVALLVLRTLDEKVLASITMGAFALLVVWIACERPNSEQGRAISALIKRLLAVGTGDFSSPTPPVVKKKMPALGAAVETLFENVRKSLEEVQVKAMYDQVTSLPNRLYFRRESERLLECVGREGKAAMLFIDLDGFKEVNDSLGHAQGDRVLEMVADRLRGIVEVETKPHEPCQPVVARLSGDEFTLLFPSVLGLGEAKRLGETVLAALSEPFNTGGRLVQVGASIGISLWPMHAEDLPGLMKTADMAMYRAKSLGRSQVCVYDDGVADAFDRKAETELGLREALNRDELFLTYQPQICARSGAVVGAEALLRWDRPGFGFLFSDDFMPAAEGGPLIRPLGDWMIGAVVDTLNEWRGAGLPLRMSFDLIQGQMESPRMLERLRQALAQTGPSPWLIELEFPEPVAMGFSEGILRELTALRRDGVTIAIDNFGSGYSNFAKMKNMPLDKVKLDRSLVEDIETSESARNMTAAIIHLVHGLQVQVVAEGVERTSQLELLRAVGCDIFQGSAFAKPMPHAEFRRWMADQDAERMAYPG